MTEQERQPTATLEAAAEGNPEEQPDESGGLVGTPGGGVGTPQPDDRYSGKDPDLEQGQQYGGGMT